MSLIGCALRTCVWSMLHVFFCVEPLGRALFWVWSWLLGSWLGLVCAELGMWGYVNELIGLFWMVCVVWSLRLSRVFVYCRQAMLGVCVL